jgi:hypothetical protein
MSPIVYQDVYYVEPSSAGPFNPVAIRPTIDEQEKTIYWEDTSRGTSCRYTKIHITLPSSDTTNQTPVKIQVTTSRGDVILQKLTLDIYNKYVKDRVAGRPTFHYDEEVRDYYLQTEFQLF